MIDESLLSTVREDLEGMSHVAEQTETLAAVARAMAELERVWLADAEGTPVRVHCLQIRLFVERALLVVRSAAGEPA
jgi:hypothetical protein